MGLKSIMEARRSKSVDANQSSELAKKLAPYEGEVEEFSGRFIITLKINGKTLSTDGFNRSDCIENMIKSLNQMSEKLKIRIEEVKVFLNTLSSLLTAYPSCDNISDEINNYESGLADNEKEMNNISELVKILNYYK